ncbi:MAG: PAS domain S-box protein [Longimicrobiales bacterium]
MNDELRLDERLFRELLEAVEESVIVLDREGRIRYVNYMEEGYELGDVIGKDASDFIHPAHQAAHRDRLHRILTHGEPELFEVPGRGDPGERQWYAGRASAIRRKGRVVGVLVVMNNVTELRRARKEAGHLKRLLPVCPWCNQKVRVSPEKWISLEEYLYSSDDLYVTHGMCPDCGIDMVEGS